MASPFAQAQPAAGASKAATSPTVVELVLGPARLPLTSYYTIAFRLRGAALDTYSDFPELEGFKKSGKTSTTTTRIVQGKSFSELTITQRYAPYGEGKQVIKPFQLTVNGQAVRSAGATVQVEAVTTAPPAITAPASPPADLQAVGDLDKLFGKPKAALYQEVPDHASLAVVAERSRVFVGEGVKVGLYFYLQPADQELLNFHDFSGQLPTLLQQLHQTTAWEVPAASPSEKPDTLRRNGQLYLRFRLAEAFYYPLTAEPLRFPALSLTMIKFKKLKKPEPGQNNLLPTYKTFAAPAVQVQVRPLPPHPLRDQVPVGDYQLREAISRTSFRVGQAFTYAVGVEGRGNLASVLMPALTAPPDLEVYGPELREKPVLGGGTKLFRYRLVAHRPGMLRLDSLLQFIVFNPRTARYDTLRPELQLQVRGAATAAPSRQLKPEDDPFYGPALASADTELQPLDVYRQVRQYATWLLAGLALLAVGGMANSWRNKTAD
ncbi:BatD family protein [Hymenobacter sp. ASUV-10]|uniref:BatD family protein n=1 Tax=Hymenobacter aranciens TaxID=3063996 RepID=A0ABT9B8P9_9BACT|nr:BatD family protein [Hymenobacter sp. ASUV-10]MDO7874635.1 BatD family protein [Hymenobacter sp. ASUV-10]